MEQDPVYALKEAGAYEGTEKRSGVLEKARAISSPREDGPGLRRRDLRRRRRDPGSRPRLPSAEMALLGFLTGFFVSGSANISNDYFDRDVDRVNRPDRPLPSGRVSVAELWALFLVFAAAGLASAALLGPAVLALAAAAWGVALLYNVRLKEAGLLGNLAVAFCVSMTVILGGVAAGAVNGLVLTFGALAFLFDLGEEIASDAMDVEGDSVRSSRSIAARSGRAHALRLSGVAFSLFIALTFLPFLAGWLGQVYLVCAVARASPCRTLAARLVRSTTIRCRARPRPPSVPCMGRVRGCLRRRQSPLTAGGSLGLVHRSARRPESRPGLPPFSGKKFSGAPAAARPWRRRGTPPARARPVDRDPAEPEPLDLPDPRDEPVDVRAADDLFRDLLGRHHLRERLVVLRARHLPVELAPCSR